MRIRGRFRSSVLGTAHQRVVHDVLRMVNEAADVLGDALDPHHASPAARQLQRLLDVPAVIITDSVRMLTAEGVRVPDPAACMSMVAPVLHGARSCVTSLDWLWHPELREAVVVPLVVDGVVAGTLVAAGPTADAGLLRTVEQVGALVARLVETSELQASRSRLAGAQLAALRAQMSPHFVYNALTAIASLTTTDPHRANELLLGFATFTRYRLKGHTFVVLADELQATNTYLELERARFGDRLRVTCDIDPEVLAIPIPSLTIQPLVENALRHGLERTPGPAQLWIRAVDEGSTAVISVEDDGAGADPATVECQLNADRDDEHFGLGNVDERLRMAYGAAHGLLVETAPGAGTKVTVRVPKSIVRVSPG